MYGLVLTNAETGLISDCYSNSFGYTESNNYITNIYGFAQKNLGTIQYSTYFIPEAMVYDNNIKGGVAEAKILPALFAAIVYWDLLNPYT